LTDSTKTKKPNFWAMLLGSWFYSGKMPIASGTWGSLASLPFAWFIVKYVGVAGLGIASVFIFWVGCKCADNISENLEKKDPGVIVIDETVGQWITLLVAPLSLGYYMVGFFLFRIFDILKPWPACWADSKVEGGFGVMLDDVFAGIYAAIVLFVIINYFPIDFTSLPIVGMYM